MNTSTTTKAANPHLETFCDGRAQQVFGGVVHETEIWTPDPFDVQAIHTNARETFARLIHRAIDFPPPESGKCLLLLGEAGSGKTHLLRAFRNELHANGTGYCGYVQMTSRSDNYSKYLLRHTIKSLLTPYSYPKEESGLDRLAKGLVQTLEGVASTDRNALLLGEAGDKEFMDSVYRVADIAIEDPRFDNQVDLDLIRAVLMWHSRTARVRSLVHKWLRCEHLSARDQSVLGELVPRSEREMPHQTLVHLGRLISSVHNAAFVLCVDQLEEMIEHTETNEQPGQVFRRVVDALLAITNELPSAVMVIASLEDFFKDSALSLTQSKRDRLEHDPEPVRLGSGRRQEEIEEIVSTRLEVLYGLAELAAPNPSFYPFRSEDLERHKGMRTRHLLNFCREHRNKCIIAGRWVNPDELPGGDDDAPDPSGDELTRAWSDFVSDFEAEVIEEEEQLAELLAWAIEAVSEEYPKGIHFGASRVGRFIEVDVHNPDPNVEPLLVGLCEKRAQGGGLGNQIEELEKRSLGVPAVIVRSSAFPSSPRAAVSKLIAKLIAPTGSGRRVQVEPSDWHSMAAMKAFIDAHGNDIGFARWQHEHRPLGELASLRKILALDTITDSRPQSLEETPPSSSPRIEPTTSKPPTPAPVSTGPLLLGHSRGVSATPVPVEPGELAYHSAYLGGTGSGKTTAALSLIEQLLLRGVPAVLLDRKGDLARYADVASWGDESDQARRLRDSVEVALYTPGNSDGHNLTLPLAPADLATLPEAEQQQVSKQAATALGGMMGYKLKGVDPKMAILGKAIEVLAKSPNRPLTVRGLQRLVDDRDETLLHEVGGFEDKHYRILAENLLALALQRQGLLEGKGTPVDLDQILGRGSHRRPGRTRLAVVNTQFLGGTDAVDFWLAQFLIEVGRWASKNAGASGLQAVFLFDEADQYLPATRQPATKAPMENLLRRARSAGIGLFLATQSPGDLDYKCRDQIRLWLLGRVKESVAIAKLKPMLAAGSGNAHDKLAAQSAGQFYLVREQEVSPIQTQRSILETQQVPEERILELAGAKRP